MAHPTENFVIPEHDYQEHTGMTANHGPVTVVYKRGGASGAVEPQRLSRMTVTIRLQLDLLMSHLGKL